MLCAIRVRWCRPNRHPPRVLAWDRRASKDPLLLNVTAFPATASTGAFYAGDFALSAVEDERLSGMPE